MNGCTPGACRQGIERRQGGDPCRAAHLHHIFVLELVVQANPAAGRGQRAGGCHPCQLGKGCWGTAPGLHTPANLLSHTHTANASKHRGSKTAGERPPACKESKAGGGPRPPLRHVLGRGAPHQCVLELPQQALVDHLAKVLHAGAAAVLAAGGAGTGEGTLRVQPGHAGHGRRAARRLRGPKACKQRSVAEVRPGRHLRAAARGPAGAAPNPPHRHAHTHT